MSASAESRKVVESENVSGSKQAIIDGLADIREQRARLNRQWEALSKQAKEDFRDGTYYSATGNHITLFESTRTSLDKSLAEKLIAESTGAQKAVLLAFYQKILKVTTSTTVKSFGNVTEDKATDCPNCGTPVRLRLV